LFRIHKLAVWVCVACLISAGAGAQTVAVKPIQFMSGTVLTFHLQTRLKVDAGDVLNDFPADATLQVKMLSSTGPAANPDGIPFQGIVMLPLSVAGSVVIHPGALVNGLQVLLRNKNHPEGFRYELLITNVVNQGESHTVSAFFDTPSSGTNESKLSGPDLATTGATVAPPKLDEKTSTATAY
jgi:hypothetical protein